MRAFNQFNSEKSKIALILLSLCVISMIHYQSSLKYLFWHEIFQRAYYLPIIIAALWYGFWGGLLTAAAASLFYLPFVIVAWHGFQTYQFNKYSEIVMCFLFGALTGVLSDQQRKQRKKLQETAQRLSEVYDQLQQSFESLRRTERLSALGQAGRVSAAQRSQLCFLGDLARLAVIVKIRGDGGQDNRPKLARSPSRKSGPGGVSR